MHAATLLRNLDLDDLHMHFMSLVEQDSVLMQAVTQLEKDTEGEDVASTRAKKESAATTKSAGRMCLGTTIVRYKCEIYWYKGG